MCTCGDPNPHVIMRRTTADGIEVNLWDDGAITGALGIGLPKVPLARPKTADAVKRARSIAWLMLGEVCLYNQADLPDLYLAAKKAASLDGMPGTVRKAFREIREARNRLNLKLNWNISRADARGKTTERWARLPFVRWPGMYVMDFCGSEGSGAGRYQVCHRKHSPRGGNRHDVTVESTGLTFRTLRELFDHLDTYPTVPADSGGGRR